MMLVRKLIPVDTIGKLNWSKVQVVVGVYVTSVFDVKGEALEV